MKKLVVIMVVVMAMLMTACGHEKEVTITEEHSVMHGPTLSIERVIVNGEEVEYYHVSSVTVDGVKYEESGTVVVTDFGTYYVD